MTVSQIVDRAIRDRDFRAKLIANPTETSKAAGLALNAGQQVQVFVQGQNELHLFIGRKTNIPQLNDILDQAKNNPEFKRQLLENPRKLIEEKTGNPFPVSAAIQVHDLLDVIPVVIPSEIAEAELNDAELESVAGGGRFGTLIRDMFCRNSTVNVYESTPMGPISGVAIVNHSATETFEQL